MAITLGVGPALGQAAPGTSAVITLNSTTIGRSILILIVWQDNGGTRTITSVQVSGESNATLLAGSHANSGGADHTQIAVLSNNTAGGNKTITINMSGSAYVTATAHEIVGADTAAAVDNSNNATGVASAPITGSITTNTANCALFGLTTAPGAMTAGSGFTALSNPRTNNGFNDEDEYLLDAGATGSKTVNFDSADSGSFFLLSMVAIKLPAAAGGWGGLLAHKANRLVMPFDM